MGLLATDIFFRQQAILSKRTSSFLFLCRVSHAHFPYPQSPHTFSSISYNAQFSLPLHPLLLLFIKPSPTWNTTFKPQALNHLLQPNTSNCRPPSLCKVISSSR